MWNGPLKGDWSKVDFSKPPWANGIAELTHEEVLFVIETCKQFTGDDFNIQSRYNESTNYEKAINGDTYAIIKQYDPLVHTLGIDANGIIKPVEEVPPGEEVTEGEVKQPLGEV
jgi:hypothetical protein